MKKFGFGLIVILATTVSHAYDSKINMADLDLSKNRELHKAFINALLDPQVAERLKEAKQPTANHCLEVGEIAFLQDIRTVDIPSDLSDTQKKQLSEDSFACGAGESCLAFTITLNCKKKFDAYTGGIHVDVSRNSSTGKIGVGPVMRSTY